VISSSIGRVFSSHYFGRFLDGVFAFNSPLGCDDRLRFLGEECLLPCFRYVRCSTLHDRTSFSNAHCSFTNTPPILQYSQFFPPPCIHFSSYPGRTTLRGWWVFFLVGGLLFVFFFLGCFLGGFFFFFCFVFPSQLPRRRPY